MNLSELFLAWRKILTIVEKPEPDDYSLLLKIALGGILLAGAVGFAIHIAFYFVQGGVGGG